MGQLESFDLSNSNSITYTNKTKLCTICGIGCKSKSELERHIWTHTGVKPYMCPHCSYSSTLKTNVRRHLVSKHGENFYQDSVGSS